MDRQVTFIATVLVGRDRPQRGWAVLARSASAGLVNSLLLSGAFHGRFRLFLGPRRCPYWIAVTAGLVGLAAAAWQEREGSRSIESESGDPEERTEIKAFEAKEAKRGKRMDRTCPSCKRPNTLSAYEAARHYQCTDCTRRDEGGYGEDL